MLNIRQLILLKALYNEELHNAILSKDKAEIEAIVSEQYVDEFEGSCSIDIARIYNDHQEQLADEEMIKRLK